MKQFISVLLLLFFGFILGLFVHIDFLITENNPKLQFSIPNWIMAICTVGILIGTWKAASYAKNAVEQAIIQNSSYLNDKIDQLYVELEKEFRYEKKLVHTIIKLYYINHYTRFSSYLTKYERDFVEKSENNTIYKNRLFIKKFLGSDSLSKLEKIYSAIRDIIDKRGAEVGFENIKIIREFGQCSDGILKTFKTYKELNGSS